MEWPDDLPIDQNYVRTPVHLPLTPNCTKVLPAMPKHTKGRPTCESMTRSADSAEATAVPLEGADGTGALVRGGARERARGPRGWLRDVVRRTHGAPGTVK